jgi:hypothetical protein
LIGDSHISTLAALISSDGSSVFQSALKTSVSVSHSQKFHYIAEPGEFLSLFPYRFDYIWAEHPAPGEKAQWKTENRHPLSDRLIRQGSYLYGVRFGAETEYCLLDIDIGSQYHPKQDPFAISRLVAALEPLGFVRYVACTSSYSKGLHLYFPFQRPLSSWKLAIAVSSLLESAGFVVRSGQLEIFPDPKPYSVNGKPSLFQAHRLPLQAGSYLVDEDWQTVWTTPERFVQQWQVVKGQNEVTVAVIHRVLKQVKRRPYTVSSKAEKFINDLNAEIESGWTGYGQTNYLLGRITMREYIFRHVMTGEKPLAGESLVSAIVDVARSLPGYFDYCRHQHEIEHRAEEWARCIENSHYFHYGDAAGKFKAKSENSSDIDSDLKNTVSQKYAQAIAAAPNWNQQQSEGARDRIRQAIGGLLEQGTLPANATARFQALVRCGIGGGTLYRHRDLWHPIYLTLANETVENPPYPPTSKMDGAQDGETSCAPCPASLLQDRGSNPAPDRDPGDRVVQDNQTGRNISANPGLRNIPRRSPDSDSAQNVEQVQQVLFEIKATQSARQEASRIAYQQQRQIRQQVLQAKQVARMQQYLDSGDPILMAEALAWASINVGLLKVRLRD